GFPKPPRFGDRPLRVARESWRHLHADVAVAAFGGIVNRAQKIGGVLNVANGNPLEGFSRLEVLRMQLSQHVGIVRAAGDRLLEDRGIGSYTAQTILFDEALQFAAGDEVAADVIQPYRLPELLQLDKRVLPLGLNFGFLSNR